MAIIHTQTKKGFSLLELIVAVGIFMVAVTINVGTLFLLSRAQQHANEFQNLQENLRFAFDSISKAAIVGKNYRCISPIVDPPPTLASVLVPRVSCPLGTDAFIFESFTGSDVAYRWNSTDQSIERSVNQSQYVAITDPRVKVEAFKIYTTGVEPNDMRQPKITIFIKASIQGSRTQLVPIEFSTTISQRKIDT